MTLQLERKKGQPLIKEGYLELVNAAQTLFNPYRLLIMQALNLHENVEYRQLKNAIKITDGNLASHLRALEGAELIRYHKEIINRKPRTSYEITAKGKSAVEQLRKSLESLFNPGAHC